METILAVGARVPDETYFVDTGDLPPVQRAVFKRLFNAAGFAGELYAKQRALLKPVENDLGEIAKKDDLAEDPITVPNSQGKFVYPWQHEKFLPILREAQTDILRAANIAAGAGDQLLGKCLFAIGDALTSGDRKTVYELYAPLTSRINFHFDAIEPIKGKRMWQSFLGIADRDETRTMRQEVAALRAVASRRYAMPWPTPVTNISVDHAARLGGYNTLIAKNQLRAEAGLPVARWGMSAQNIPNEVDLTTKYGTRIIFYDVALRGVVTEEIVKLSAPFTKMSLMPSIRGSRRFLAAHELIHDLRYSKNLGEFHHVVREDFANQGGITACGDLWNPEQYPRQFESVIRAANGYATRDNYSVLSDPQALLDLDNLTQLDYYIPGNLAWMNFAIQEGAFILQDGRIAEFKLPKCLQVSTRLAAGLNKLLLSGNIDDVRNHFEIVLPKAPVFSRQIVTV